MKRIISILLIALMLIFNIGFSVNTHFCGGKAVKSSFSLGIHNLDCGMKKMAEGCETKASQNGQIKSKPCCENQHAVLMLDENTEIQSSTASVNPDFAFAFIHCFVEPLFFVDQTFYPGLYYVPPPPDKDIQVFYQTFII